MGFIDDIAAGLAKPQFRARIAKASIANQLASGFSSLWRATGHPAQGAIPAAAAICTRATTGSLASWDTPPAGKARHLAYADVAMSVVSASLFFVDRLAHMGGLVGNVATAQTVNLSLASLAGNRASSDLREVTWWLEIYTDIGTTATTATITYVSRTDGSTRTITGFPVGGASPAGRAGRVFPLDWVDGHPIESITSVQLAATTGVAGNFGFTATMRLGSAICVVANRVESVDWAMLPISQLHEDSCIAMVMLAATTSTGTVTGNVAIPEITVP